MNTILSSIAEYPTTFIVTIIAIRYLLVKIIKIMELSLELQKENKR